MRQNFRKFRCWPQRAHKVAASLRSRRHFASLAVSQRSEDRIAATIGVLPAISMEGYHDSAAEEVPRFDASMLLGPLASSLQDIYDVLPVALGVIGRDGLYLAANIAYAAMHGAAPQHIIGRAVADYVPGADQQLREDFQRFDAGMAAIEREVSCHGRHYLVALQPVRDAEGMVQAVTSALVDITARKRMEQSLEQARRHWQFHASHDHLTGLPNRRHIDDALAVEAARCARSAAPLSVMMIDVDYFKKYNDQVGHQRGDDCLCAIATQLRLHMRRHSDLVGRYGGEEFIALLPGTDSAGAYHVALGILEGMRSLGIGHSASPYGCVTLSIGIATLVDASIGKVQSRCDALLGHADRALYAAKAAGRNTVRIHSAGLNDQGRLAAALVDGEALAISASSN